MKRKLKVSALVLCFTLFAAMALGSGSSGSDEEKEIKSVDTADTAEEQAVEEDEQENSSSGVTIEEQVLYEENGVKITATGLEDGFMGTELKLLIENNSSKNITVQARSASVNDFMVDTVMSSDVTAGKKANDSLTFVTTGLKESGIEAIAKMEFSFHIMDAENWDEIADSDMITVNTSIASDYVQKVDDSGEVLFDQENMKIVGKGLSEKDSFWGPGLILYIENSSDKNITVQVRDVSVNGFMVSSSMSEEVAEQKKAMSAVQFFDTDLEENSITDIKDIELSFHVFDTKTWDTIYDSDVIKLSF